MQCIFAKNGKNVARIRRPVAKRLTRFYAVAVTHKHVLGCRHKVFKYASKLIFNRNHAFCFRNSLEFDGAGNLRKNGRHFRLPRFKQFRNARNTAGNIVRLCRFFRHFCKRIARLYLLFVFNLQNRARRKIITSLLVSRLIGDENTRLFYVKVQVGNHALNHIGLRVGLFGQG